MQNENAWTGSTFAGVEPSMEEGSRKGASGSMISPGKAAPLYHRAALGEGVTWARAAYTLAPGSCPPRAPRRLLRVPVVLNLFF